MFRCVRGTHRTHSVLRRAALATRQCTPTPLVTPTPTPGACTQGLGAEVCPASDIPPQECPVDTYDSKPMTNYEIVTSLGKSKLSWFVTSTTVAGYVLCGGMDPVLCTALALGTVTQSMSANTVNQCMEVKYDAMMKRTHRRVLVTNQITRSTAMMIAATELSVGTAVVYACSPMAAGLGVLNWFLYVAMYTPLKRISTTNTWFGAIVGAVPPLMGAVAATGSPLLAPAMGPGWLLAAILFMWQIPHFMSLAFHCRRDYEGAGFKMLAFNHPWRASAYAVGVSGLMGGVTVFGPAMLGMPVEAWYYPTAAAFNGLMTFKAVRFHQDPVKNCRSCFVFSYMWLLMMLILLTVNHFTPVARLTAMSDDYFAANSDHAV